MRLSTVVSPVDGGVYDALLPEFERQSGYRVAISSGTDVFGPARVGKFDVVLSHYGHKDLEGFVQLGFGLWPQVVFSNPHALLGPSRDPAAVRGLSDLVEAFRRIARAAAPFIVNNLEGLDYLADVVWQAAGQPAKGTWYHEPGSGGQPAIALAARQGGYTLWGLTPFHASQKQQPVALEPLVVGDPLLERIMVTVAVNPAKVAGVNAAGAAALQRYLLTPATQARLRTYRAAGMTEALWWPGGGNNAPSVLPTP